MKKCSKCEEEKDESEFNKKRDNKDGLRGKCRECQKKEYQKNKKYFEQRYEQNKEKYSKQQKQYRENNKEKVKEINRQYHKNNKEKIKERKKQYFLKNPEKKKEYYENSKEGRNKKRKERYHTDLNFRFKQVLSRSIGKALKRNNSSKDNVPVHEKLDYTEEQLVNHLLNHPNKKEWMTKDNYGRYEEGKLKWHIDHIIPHSFFHYTDMDCQEFKDCWALSNLQPLGALENMKKGNKIIAEETQEGKLLESSEPLAREEDHT